FFTSTSANIEANFETSIYSLPFEGKTVVGNRVNRTFRINNRGFRDGKPMKLLVYNQNNSLLGHCIRASSGTLMNCFTNTAFTTPLSLADFPFYFKDTNN